MKKFMDPEMIATKLEMEDVITTSPDNNDTPEQDM